MGGDDFSDEEEDKDDMMENDDRQPVTRYFKLHVDTHYKTS